MSEQLCDSIIHGTTFKLSLFISAMDFFSSSQWCHTHLSVTLGNANMAGQATIVTQYFQIGS